MKSFEVRIYGLRVPEGTDVRDMSNIIEDALRERRMIATMITVTERSSDQEPTPKTWEEKVAFRKDDTNKEE